MHDPNRPIRRVDAQCLFLAAATLLTLWSFAAAAMTPCDAPVPLIATNALTITDTVSENVIDQVHEGGDVNGDGFSEIIIASQKEGTVHVFYGASNPDDTYDLLLVGENPNDGFGLAADASGDFNGDGYNDILVGAYAFASPSAFSGRAYLYFGGANPDSIPDLVFESGGGGAQFGHFLSYLGDVNGDGYDDLAVAAYAHSQSFVYLGGATPDAVSDLVLSGVPTSDELGISQTGGDFNGDGFNDIIVGADQNAAGGSKDGYVHIYFGGAVLDNVVDVILDNETPGERFSRVASADFNGDGYDDIAVGAHTSDANGVNAGRVYIYFGSASSDSLSDIIIDGEAAGDVFTIRGGSAGDIDGDGYADLIASARLNDEGAVDGGKVYLFRGSASMDGVADHCFVGSIAGGEYGAWATGTGDVNGDGFDDIAIVSQPDFPTTYLGFVDLYLMESGYLTVAAVTDVADDQGGWLRVKWYRAEGDSPVSPTATQYGIWRHLTVAPKSGGELDLRHVSWTPGIGIIGPQQAVAFGLPSGWWEGLGSIPAVQRDAYSTVVPSLGDSTIAGIAWTQLLITAHTADPAVYWSSEPVSGYSVDNIAPSAPAALNVAYAAGRTVLTWDEPYVVDLAGYRVYRRTDGGAYVFVEPSVAPTWTDNASDPWQHQYAVTAVDDADNESPMIEQGTATSAPDVAALRGLILSQNAPNPFNPSTVIRFSLRESGPARLRIFDEAGRLVTALINEEVSAGEHSVRWNGTDSRGRSVSSGVYFYRLEYADLQQTRKMVLVE
jgi:FG-GAP repeat/FlgD Ig-like domain